MRNETVLADWLQLRRRRADEIHGRGQRDAAPGHRLDHRSGAAIQARRARPARSPSPRFNMTEANARGERQRDPLQGSRPVRGERRDVHDLRRAAPRLVPARRRARDRQPAQGRHGARRDGVLQGRADRRTRRGSSFPLSNERKSGFLTPILGSTGTRGFEVRGAVLPQPRAELRRHAHAALHDQARAAAGRAVPLLFGDASAVRQAAGELDAEILPHDKRHRHQSLRLQLDPQRAVHAVRCRATSTCKGLRRHLFRRPRRPHRRHVAAHAAARRRAHRTTAARGRCSRAHAELPDAAGPERSRSRRRTTAAAAARHAERRRTGSASRGADHRVRAASARPRCADRRPLGASIRPPRSPQRPVVVLHRARPACTRASTTSTRPTPATPDTIRIAVVPIAEPRRRPRVRARQDVRRPRRSCRRSSRARSTSTSRIAARTSCRCSTPRSTTSTSRSSSPRTAISATTASATRTSSRSRSLALPRPRHRRRAPAPRRRPALLFRRPARDADRAAALGVVVRLPASAPKAAVRRVVDVEPAAVQLRRRAGRALQRRHALHAGRRQGAERDLSLHAPTRRPDRRRSSRSSSSTCPANGRSTTTGRCSAAGTTRCPTTRRSRRSRASSTMAIAGCCGSSASA